MNLPPSLVQSLTKVKGFNKEAFEAVHASGDQVTSIRLNPAKVLTTTQLDFPEDILLHPIPWSSQGFYLSKRPSFTLDPLLHAGGYYVQEASSMFLEEVLRQVIDVSAPLKVLDLCAAPGGKSTLLHSIISDGSLLVSNELIKSRAAILVENITKWGASNVIVTNNDAANFQRLPGYFDVIVADAPCSGSGLFRKDVHAIEEWSDQSVVLCSQRQQRILEDILPALKPGGILIYSTCSYSELENEDISNWLSGDMQLQSIRIELKDDWQIIESTSGVNNAYGYRFFPDQVKGEGFYIAAFRKEQTGERDDIKSLKAGSKKSSKLEKLSPAAMHSISRYLDKANEHFYIIQNGDVIAMPAFLEKDLAVVQSALYIKKAGLTIGALIRDELVPGHELAVSGRLASSVRHQEVSKEDALQFLRRQEMGAKFLGNGWAVVTYRNLPLGWIKLLQNRVNNYYPKEWRILNK